MQATRSIESQDLSVGELFRDFYVVPSYQREYVWEEDQVERLLTDVLNEYDPESPENSDDYFIGSLVVCPRDDGRYDVIDGQQRLTTLFVIFCAVKMFLKEQGEPIPQQLSTQIAAMRLGHDGLEVPQFRVELHYSEGQGILRMFSDPEDFKAFKLNRKSRSIDNLNTAFHVCHKFLRSTFEKDAQAVRKFYAFLINRVKVIRIATGSIARALKVFETINDRGVGLDSMDLLKNLLFMKADQASFGRLKSTWQEMVDLIYQNKEKPLRFLRYYIFASFREDRLREDEIYKWFERNEHRANYSADPVAFTHSLYSAAYAYTQYLNGKYTDGKSNRFLENIKRVSGASRQHLMLLLAARHLPEPIFLELCRHIENLLFLYIVVRESGREFERRFARWAPEVRLIQSESDLSDFVARRFTPEVERLRQRFYLAFEEMTDRTVQQYRLRYILGKICQFVNYRAYARESDLDLSRFMEKGVEIEHILPQTANRGFKEQMAGSAETYDRAVHMLGNLTLIEKPINASMGNASFEKKRNGFANSSFLITKQIAQPVKVGENTSIDRIVQSLEYFDEWNLETIKGRQLMFARLAAQTWGID